MTIEFWANGGSTLPKTNCVFEAIGDRNQRILNIHLPWTDGNIYFDAGNQSGFDRIQKVAQPAEYKGDWTHWAFVKDAVKGEMLIYRNSVLWHQSKGMTKTLAGITKFAISTGLSDGPTWFWHGSLTEFRVWNTARTEQEIKANMKLRQTGTEAGLVGYWPMNEISKSGQIRDLTANSYHGIISGNAVLGDEVELGFATIDKVPPARPFNSAPEAKSRAMVFDAVDDLFTIPYPLHSASMAISLEFWANGGSKLPKQTAVFMAVHAQNERVISIHLPWEDGIIYFDAGNQNGFDRIQKVAQPAEYKDNWTHWAFVKDVAKGEMTIYRNGTLWHQGKGMTKPMTGIMKFFIGGWFDGKYLWNGALTEFRIWNKACSEQEVKANMNLRLTGRESGLVAYWPMNDIGKNGQIKDLTMNGYHGTLAGNAVLSEEFELGLHTTSNKVVLSAICLNGQNEHIEVPYLNSWTSTDFTVSCWAKVSGKKGEWRSVISAASTEQGYLLNAGNDDNWQFWVGTNGNWQTIIGSPIVMDKWTHLAISHEKDIMKLYVDGKFLAEKKCKYTPANQPLRFGSGNTEAKDGPNFLFCGNIAELSMWKKALSLENITLQMHNRLTGKEADLVAYWPLNTITESNGRTTPEMTGCAGAAGQVYGNAQVAAGSEAAPTKPAT